MKNLIVLLGAALLLCIAVGCQSGGSSSTPTSGLTQGNVLQLRLVADTPAADTEPVTLSMNREGKAFSEVLNLQKAVVLDQSALKSARVNKDSLGHPVIDLQFSSDGAKLFAEITRQNLNRRLAILVDGRVCQAPVIRSEIAGGRAQISGNFSELEAQDLARKLNAAAGRK